MNYGILLRQITTSYKHGNFKERDGYPWTIRDFFNVFVAFYELYERLMGYPHPHLRTATVERVMERLMQDEDGYYAATDYLESDLLESYFGSYFSERCDYSICHFVSDGIRHYRRLRAGEISYYE